MVNASVVQYCCIRATQFEYGIHMGRKYRQGFHQVISFVLSILNYLWAPRSLMGPWRRPGCTPLSTALPRSIELMFSLLACVAPIFIV